MRVPRFVPRLDDLESRVLQAASISVVKGVLQIVGDSSENTANVRLSSGKVEVTLSYTPSGFFLVDPGPTTIKNTYALSSINEVKFWGYGGGDTFVNRVNIKTTAYGGPGIDYLESAGGDDTLDGGDGDDRLVGGSGRNVFIGGAGNDSASGRARDSFSGLEAVQLNGIPTGNPQEKNKCGPNSAWRVINSLGGSASVQEVSDRASEQSLVSKWNLGTTGSTLVNAMNSLRRGLSDQASFSLKTKARAEDVFAALQTGRPVVAMIQSQGSEKFKAGIISYTVPRLHWIAVDGFDRMNQRVYFTDTDGKHYWYSFSQFDSLFSWDFGKLQNAALQGLGVVKGTFIV